MWVFSAGERGGLAVLALFRALGMLLCAQRETLLKESHAAYS